MSPYLIRLEKIIYDKQNASLMIETEPMYVDPFNIAKVSKANRRIYQKLMLNGYEEYTEVPACFVKFVDGSTYEIPLSMEDFVNQMPFENCIEKVPVQEFPSLGDDF